MQCPRCSHTLAGGAYESHDVYYCSECSGTLFEQAALGKTLERLSVDLFSQVSPDSLIPPLADTNDSADCPKCQAPMENYGYMGTNRVMLDACNDCRVVWVDPLELATMAQMFVKLDKNMASFRAAHRPTKLVETQVNIRMIEQTLLAAIVFA